jgi:putative transposase
MPKAIRGWKSYLARNNGIVWQKNYFDHRLRGAEQFGAKSEYVLLNPERAGLTAHTKD